MADNDKGGEALRRLLAMVKKKTRPKANPLDTLTVRLIRWVLTAALLVGVYTETGGFTTTALALTFIAIEIQCWVTQKMLDDG